MDLGRASKTMRQYLCWTKADRQEISVIRRLKYYAFSKFSKCGSCVPELTGGLTINKVRARHVAC